MSSTPSDEEKQIDELLDNYASDYYDWHQRRPAFRPTESKAKARASIQDMLVNSQIQALEAIYDMAGDTNMVPTSTIRFVINGCKDRQSHLTNSKNESNKEENQK